jgi:cobalt/nickel transport system ATP-binding protein
MDMTSNVDIGRNGNGASVVLEDVHFAYDHGPEALRGVTLNVPAGERLGIIGPSGSGKSTLLLHLNGILSGSGNIAIDGQVVNKDTISDIRKKVGLVFQNPDDQLFNPTVREDVAFGPLNMGLSPEEVDSRVAHAMSLMRLEGYEEKISHHISYGERRRVALATVLAMRPKVFAFDEPFSNLDPDVVQSFIQIINELDATVIVVSQFIIPLVACCHRLAVLKNGQLVTVGPARDIARDRELLKSCGLDFHFYHDIYHSLAKGS